VSRAAYRKFGVSRTFFVRDVDEMYRTQKHPEETLPF
jgi:hypothetical protein